MSKTRITENGIHYQRVGDYDLPMLTLPTPSESIGLGDEYAAHI